MAAAKNGDPTPMFCCGCHKGSNGVEIVLNRGPKASEMKKEVGDVVFTSFLLCFCS